MNRAEFLVAVFFINVEAPNLEELKMDVPGGITINFLEYDVSLSHHRLVVEYKGFLERRLNLLKYFSSIFRTWSYLVFKHLF